MVIWICAVARCTVAWLRRKPHPLPADFSATVEALMPEGEGALIDAMRSRAAQFGEWMSTATDEQRKGWQQHLMRRMQQKLRELVEKVVEDSAHLFADEGAFFLNDESELSGKQLQMFHDRTLRAYGRYCYLRRLPMRKGSQKTTCFPGMPDKQTPSLSRTKREWHRHHNLAVLQTHLKEEHEFWDEALRRHEECVAAREELQRKADIVATRLQPALEKAQQLADAAEKKMVGNVSGPAADAELTAMRQAYYALHQLHTVLMTGSLTGPFSAKVSNVQTEAVLLLLRTRMLEMATCSMSQALVPAMQEYHQKLGDCRSELTEEAALALLPLLEAADEVVKATREKYPDLTELAADGEALLQSEHMGYVVEQHCCLLQEWSPSSGVAVSRNIPPFTTVSPEDADLRLVANCDHLMWPHQLRQHVLKMAEGARGDTPVLQVLRNPKLLQLIVPAPQTTPTYSEPLVPTALRFLAEVHQLPGMYVAVVKTDSLGDWRVNAERWADQACPTMLTQVGAEGHKRHCANCYQSTGADRGSPICSVCLAAAVAVKLGGDEQRTELVRAGKCDKGPHHARAFGVLRAMAVAGDKRLADVCELPPDGHFDVYMCMLMRLINDEFDSPRQLYEALRDIQAVAVEYDRNSPTYSENY